VTTVRALIERLGVADDDVLGSLDAVAGAPGTIVDAAAGGFSFCRFDDERGASAVRSSPAGVLVVPAIATDDWRRDDQTLIRSATPRRTFIQALSVVRPPAALTPGIHPTAVVDPTASIDPTAVIGPHCVIGANSVIGPHVMLHPHVVIGWDVRIGAGTTVFAGTVVGADGFGYERDDDGTVLKFPHLGGVTIGAGVEIGANTCVDRGTLGDTVIDDEARVDNLVHVAHNVRIGKRAFVIALSMIGGSTVVDDDAYVAPGVALMNGITVGQRAMVGLGAVVVRSVEPDTVVMGNPAKPRQPKPQETVE
jgi:UDP-3-O-[3-hydroxymyristoyl] glucosamine N-acyltransferase